MSTVGPCKDKNEFEDSLESNQLHQVIFIHVCCHINEDHFQCVLGILTLGWPQHPICNSSELVT